MAPNIFMVVQEDYITIGTEVYRISEMYPKYWPQSVPDAKPPPNVVFVQVHTVHRDLSPYNKFFLNSLIFTFLPL